MTCAVVVLSQSSDKENQDVDEEKPFPIIIPIIISLANTLFFAGNTISSRYFAHNGTMPS